MAFQVCVRVNKHTVAVLSVASSSEEFDNFTIRQLKEKALSLFPGVQNPEKLRVIFGQDELEDDQTFDSCGVEHLSPFAVVLRMPAHVGGWISHSSICCDGDTAEPRGHESCGIVRESLGILDRLTVHSSFSQRSAEKVKEATTARATTDRHPESPSVEVDSDQQFLQSLLPALRRMDLRRREFTKAVIHQLVYEIEFSERSDISSLGAEAVQRLQTSVCEPLKPDRMRDPVCFSQWCVSARPASKEATHTLKDRNTTDYFKMRDILPDL